VHERTECVIDLVHNLRCLDPASTVLLYNGSTNPGLLASPIVARSGAVVHPAPKSMVWGRLHEFALDCMRFSTAELGADTITIVDSDQLALRPGYSALIERHLAGRDRVGMLGNAPHRQPPDTSISPAQVWFEEYEFWRPLLRSFPDGESKFLYWSFWPSTVFAAAAARELVRVWDGHDGLRAMLERSRVWATEEVLLPTLVALLGFEIDRNPAADWFVQYNRLYTESDLERAFNTADVYWMHPVPRQYNNPIRAAIRHRHGDYRAREAPPPSSGAGDAVPHLLRPSQILDTMRRTEGWLGDQEGELLISAVVEAAARSDRPGWEGDRRTVVEIGSYCGRSTIVLAAALKAASPSSRLWSIDPHQGEVGAVGQGLTSNGPTLDIFRANVAAAGVADVIETVLEYSYEVAWRQPIHLLMIDGLHDFENVSRDFHHFERWLADGALILFHDYAPYFPGVVAFVDRLIAGGSYRRVELAETLILVEKCAAPDVNRPRPRLLRPAAILETMRRTPGWLDDAEAELLMSAALYAVGRRGTARNIVEIGSYCGRSTIVLASVVAAGASGGCLWAIDPHEGQVGAADQGLQHGEPTLDRFRANVAGAGVASVIETVVRRSYEVGWRRPIDLLLIDGLHDFANVSRDFLHFEPWIADGGLIAFHDYASYYPGVMALVDELLANPGYRQVELSRSLMVVEKRGGAGAADRGAAAVFEAPQAAAAVADHPLVSCIMPTCNRRPLVPQALAYFTRQDYPNLELIVIDDGDDPVDALLPRDPRIKYMRLTTPMTMAAKHNLACELATGEIICHWDDDDWMAPWRVSYQVKDLLSGPADTICGLSTLLFYDPAARRAWRYRYPEHARRWISGATFCYRKNFWDRHRFPEVPSGADTTFIWGLDPSCVRAHADGRFYVATVHPANTSPRRVDAPPFQPCPSDEVERLLGADLDFYLRWPLSLG